MTTTSLTYFAIGSIEFNGDILTLDPVEEWVSPFQDGELEGPYTVYPTPEAAAEAYRAHHPHFRYGGGNDDHILKITVTAEVVDENPLLNKKKMSAKEAMLAARASSNEFQPRRA